MNVCIRQGSSTDSRCLAALLNELLSEIMTCTGEQHFHIDYAATQKRVEEWLLRGTYVAFVASRQDSPHILGFVAFYESYALYAEGVF